MNLIDAFLSFTVISYFIAGFFSCLLKPVTKNALNLGLIGKIIECIMLYVFGFLLASGLFIDNQLLWLICAMVWTADAIATYLGYVQFNIIYQNDPSNTHQVAMFVWDSLIAICCFTKILNIFFY